MGIRAAVRALDAHQQTIRPPLISTADTVKLQVLREKIAHDDFEAEHCSDPDLDYCHTCENYADCFGKDDDEGHTPGDGH